MEPELDRCYDGASELVARRRGIYVGVGTTSRKRQQTDVYNITDDTQIAGLAGQRGSFVGQGISVLSPMTLNPKESVETSLNRPPAWWTHSFNLGYTWQFPNTMTTRFSRVPSTLSRAKCHRW